MINPVEAGAGVAAAGVEEDAAGAAAVMTGAVVTIAAVKRYAPIHHG